MVHWYYTEVYLLRHIIHNLSHHLHLLQMLPSMIRMDHLILNSNIIPPKEFHNLATWMDKVGNVINDPVNGNLVTLESLEGTKVWLGGVIIDEVGRGCIDLGGDAIA